METKYMVAKTDCYKIQLCSLLCVYHRAKSTIGLKVEILKETLYIFMKKPSGAEALNDTFSKTPLWSLCTHINKARYWAACHL